MIRVASIVTLTFLFAAPANAETVDIKYRGPVDLKPFECTDITRSSFVNRVCYDKKNEYMVIKLKETYYHYCEISPQTIAAFMAADSMGRYFNANITGTKDKRGPFDCREKRVPTY